jgi:hypothetical protein
VSSGIDRAAKAYSAVGDKSETISVLEPANSAFVGFVDLLPGGFFGRSDTALGHLAADLHRTGRGRRIPPMQQVRAGRHGRPAEAKGLEVGEKRRVGAGGSESE